MKTVRFLLLTLMIAWGLTLTRAQEATPDVTPSVPLIVVTAVPTAAPTATPLPVVPLESGSVEGSLNDGTPRARYSFNASRDEGVTIQLETTSGNLDPLLNLYNANGLLIASNDDQAPGERNARIALTLAAAGTYIIEAARFEGGDTLTSGTFRLTLTRSSAQATDEPDDLLANPPNFGVDVALIAYQDVGAGRIEGDTPVYFAFAGEQGDLVRLILTRTSGDVLPRLNLYDGDRFEIGRDAQTRETEAVLYATLPQTGWYLIEAGRRENGGTGTVDLFINRLANAVLQVGEQITGAFSTDAPVQSYIVNARLGDQISATMFTTDAASGVQPTLELLDLGLRTLDRATGERFATINAQIPRSAPYILRVTNRAPQSVGGFNLRLSNVPTNPVTLATNRIAYNDQVLGRISNDDPVDLLRFSGKTGELVTITMTGKGALDPYLILMDGDLNELAANDDSAASRDARIAQFRLPKDGDYIILASRSSLAAGGTSGDYTLALTAGEIRLNTGALSMTLEWSSPADLNLFVRDPDERSINWSSPEAPSGGALQIDSHSGCQTPSDQPIEHVYWALTPPPGDYVIWAWYQNGCGGDAPEAIRLTVRVNGEPLIVNESTLALGERLQITVRVTRSGEGFIVDSGSVVRPSAQQTASEGGDMAIRIDEPFEADVTDDVYAHFYRFDGVQGETIRIRAETLTGDLDPMVILRNADDRTLPDGLNDDADDTTRDAALTYTLPYSGQYIVAVTRFAGREGTTTGRYRLLVEQVTP